MHLGLDCGAVFSRTVTAWKPNRVAAHPGMVAIPSCKVICLDLEGVLVPEIWIASRSAPASPNSRTTRDEPDYDKLMRFRIGLLRQHGLKLADIQR